VVNCARGGIIDEAALARAIKGGIVAGAALDVFVEEPPPPTHELLALPQVVVTPHLGASTEEAQLSVAVDIAVAVRDALLGRGIRNAVNVPSMDPELLKLLEPSLRLSEALGGLQAQLTDGHVQEVKIRYVGDLVKHDLAALTIAFLKGLLTPSLQETVNYVNAALLAKERGIKVIESKSTQSEDFANLISTEIRTEAGVSRVDGSCVTRRDPRIVRIQDFTVEAIPHGPMVMIQTQDTPGFIGKVGTILGAHRINIARMTFGRTRPGGEALNLFNVDQPVPPAVVQELKAVPHVTAVRVIKL
ncbi:MAG: ACT domain-containing protein, partial [Candidatus Omnitrophica bacterium]|nr:ACT domain-containing protein [Candidatus Omnitrophota bacterium]